MERLWSLTRFEWNFLFTRGIYTARTDQQAPPILLERQRAHKNVEKACGEQYKIWAMIVNGTIAYWYPYTICNWDFGLFAQGPRQSRPAPLPSREFIKVMPDVMN